MNVERMRHIEETVLNWCNMRIRHPVLDRLLGTLTHLGGATCTITVSLLFALLGSGSLRRTAICSIIALTVSHIIAALIKKLTMRRRPYLSRPHLHTARTLLKDYSFPSGHTTAIFSVATPFVLWMPLLGLLLIPLAAAVALSRIYLGLHYPSDCAAGCLLGTTTAAVTFVLM